MEKESRKRRSWLRLLPVLALAALALVLMLFRIPKVRNAPSLVEEESWFSGLVVQDNTVYFLCTLTVRNPTEKAIAVEINGDFSADVEGGLLLGRELYAFRLDDKVNSDFLSLDAATQKQMTDDDKRRFFLLRPGDNCFWVVFPGAHGKTDVKQDRLLPPIRFLPLADVTPEAVSAAMDCRIYKDPESCRTFLLDGKETEVLCYPGGYGFTSAVAWDYDGNGVQDLLFTGSEGSGIHRSYLTLFDRTRRESQELYLYTPRDFSSREAYGSDLLVEQETDEGGAPVFTVYTADVQVQNDDLTDLRFTKKGEAGVVSSVNAWWEERCQPLFWPSSKEFLPPTQAPSLCRVSLGDEEHALSGEKAAELFWICGDAMHQASPGSSNTLGGERPVITLTFPLDDRSEWECFYSIDETDKCLFGFKLVSAQYAWQLPAGTYDRLLAAVGKQIAGNAVYRLFEGDGVYSLQLYSPEGDPVWAWGPGSREPRVVEEEPGLWSVSLSAGPSLSLHWTVFYKPETGQLSDPIYGILARDGERVLRIAGKSLVLREIFAGRDQVVLDSFSEPLAQTVEPFISAAFTEDGKAVVVTCLAGEDCHEVTETIPLP